MTVTTTETGSAQRVVDTLRRTALVIGRVVGAIGSRWDAFVESGQFGPSSHAFVSRHTGGRF